MINVSIGSSDTKYYLLVYFGTPTSKVYKCFTQLQDEIKLRNGEGWGWTEVEIVPVTMNKKPLGILSYNNMEYNEYSCCEAKCICYSYYGG